MMNQEGNLTLESMIMLSKFSNFPDELSENDELREYELSGSDCTFPRVDWTTSQDILSKFVKENRCQITGADPGGPRGPAPPP